MSFNWDEWDYDMNPAEYVNQRVGEGEEVTPADAYYSLNQYIDIDETEQATYLDAQAIKLYNGGRFINFEAGNWQIDEDSTWKDNNGELHYN